VDDVPVLLEYDAVFLGNWFPAFEDNAMVSEFGNLLPSDQAGSYRRNRNYLITIIFSLKCYVINRGKCSIPVNDVLL